MTASNHDTNVPFGWSITPAGVVSFRCLVCANAVVFRCALPPDWICYVCTRTYLVPDDIRAAQHV